MDDDDENSTFVKYSAHVVTWTLLWNDVVADGIKFVLIPITNISGQGQHQPDRNADVSKRQYYDTVRVLGH